MTKGIPVTEYYRNSSVQKPIEQIYADMDAFTCEISEGEEELYEEIDLWVPLPPLFYENRFIKGIFFSKATDLLLQRYPQLSEIFHSASISAWSSYPYSNLADIYFTLYQNPSREAWFQKTHPEKANKLLIPLQDADYTHEYFFAPMPGLPKDIDVLYISRLHYGK